MFSATEPFSLYFSLNNGLSNEVVSRKRHLSEMKGMFLDDDTLKQRVQNDDPLVYEFYTLDIPETPGDLAFGTSIVYPGKVGDEYFMTKGHFHTIIDTAEVYYCIGGEGYLLMETTEGEWDAQRLTRGKAVYVPKCYAHRSINTGSEPLITFFTFRADAGHDYKTIENKGFHKLIVERDGKPKIIDNPKWH